MASELMDAGLAIHFAAPGLHASPGDQFELWPRTIDVLLHIKYFRDARSKRDTGECEITVKPERVSTCCTDVEYGRLRFLANDSPHREASSLSLPRNPVLMNRVGRF